MSNLGVQLMAPFMGTGEEAVGLAVLICKDRRKKDMLVGVYLRDVSLAMRHFERVQCEKLEFVNPKLFSPLIYPARQTYVRGGRPKRAGVVAERPEICEIDSQAMMHTDGVSCDETWDLSNGIISAVVPTTNRVFGRILVLAADGVLFRAMLKRMGRGLSADIIGTGELPHTQALHSRQNGMDQITKETASQAHVSVTFQKRLRPSKLLWITRISYTYPHCSSDGPQRKMMMVLGEGTEDDERLFAAGRGLDKIVTRLLAREGVEVDCRDLCQRTPILRGAEGDHINVVSRLFEHGASPESVDIDGRNSLHLASENGHTETSNFLLAQGRVCTNSNDDALWTPLDYAAANGHSPMVELLLNQPGIRIDTKDKCRRTPLLYAARGGAYRDC